MPTDREATPALHSAAMIPSTLAAEVTRALQDFLATGFGPSNAALSSVMEDFLDAPDNLVKGPYLAIDLPFQRAAGGEEPFPRLPLGFTPWRHQRVAFDRVKAGKSTVVATGTGSGKTECFLYPILDHCLAQAGSPGVKAILIYPMNALASDQAARIAKLIQRTPALRGKVSAGLYVGETGASPRDRMTGEHLIENREKLREWPPDILLTNYKMLDLLLTRPIDFPLWRHNGAGTLRFLVVDELHTFDGAQGTDLACLVRRLRTRLQAEQDLVCVGTSATIGSEGNRDEIIGYVSSLFHQPFELDAIVGETRQSIDEFLADAIISDHLLPAPDLAERVDPERYASAQDYVRAQYEVFFGQPPPDDFDTPAGRMALGERLREHASFVNLLRVLDGVHPTPVATVLDRLQRSLRVSSKDDAANVLNALCALICVARGKDDSVEDSLPPFLTVKLHLWVRELRRMVCSVRDEAVPSGPNERDRPSPHRLRFSDDLNPNESPVHLPLVQCRECHTTGWACVKSSADSKVGQDLRVFYNRFFMRDPDVQYLFPLAEGEEPPQRVRGDQTTICGACGHIGSAGTCTACGSGHLVDVFRPHAVAPAPRDSKRTVQLSRDCPYCHAREALIILGARASSLLSTALAQLFASGHNDDRKVIAFSDNVQDAAHRGSFFAARTWRNSVRTAIAQVVPEQGSITFADLLERVVDWWSDAEQNPAAFDEQRFISEFIAPDRMWLRDFEALRQDGQLPGGSNLPELVKRRLRWDTFAEFTFAGTIGRTLERTRTAAVGFDQEAVEAACETVLVRIQENFGELRDIEEIHARSLVLGVLRRMRERGAVENPVLQGYLRSGGNPFAMRNDPAMQRFGPRSALPVFPAPISEEQGIEALAGPSWYRDWTMKVLGEVNPLLQRQDTADVLLAVMGALLDAGLIAKLAARKTEVWALAPKRLRVTRDVAVMRAGNHSRPLILPASEAALWQDVPSLDFASSDRYTVGEPGKTTWAGRFYSEADIHRIVSAEHTALISREERDRLQARFAAPDPKPWEPNLLSATPTLELGVDIGDLSTVVLCSVPPATVNYQQRTGRAGRRDGNACNLTVATAQPHDLYYYAEPLEMLASAVDPPGIFLNAPAVLERQLAAFCFDRWVASDVGQGAVPDSVGTVLNAVERGAEGRFPYPLLEFVNANADDLLARFIAAFEKRAASDQDLSESSREYLRDYLLGGEGKKSLRVTILDCLMQASKDRLSLRNDAEMLTRRIRALQRSAQDEATKKSIAELDRERREWRGLVRKINQRETFGFLTDEGLLPNYAFPQAGVTLRSVVFKERPEEDEDDDAVVYEYVRPAVAALGEFAPENEFYAGGRRVAIRRVDTRVSPIEEWRLCPMCDYCEKIDGGDNHAVCPACGDPGWADSGQRRQMLRLSLVHAATTDERSRIMDERDDREPLFYTRQLTVACKKGGVDGAFAAAASAQVKQPFGFEYVSSATFREMNFGRADEQQAPTSFAGRSMPRKGFAVCKRCGGVQFGGAVRHTSTCNSTDDSEVLDCLYLYREFESEAVRMLLPAVGSLNEEQRLTSVIAALELGLRKRFAGAVDHLRATTTQALASDTYLKFVVLYDTVPGGTGYLKQIMNEPEDMLAIFRSARDALIGCECNADPAKDGCYRCLYAYRRSFEMADISREAAVEVLNAVLDHAESLEKVAGLETVKVNPILESELEARFVAALGGCEVDGEAVRVRDDVVAGKPGFILAIGERTYAMEAQASCGEAEGVAIASRPDFLIRSMRESDELPPIAVFTDGYEFHRDKVDEDAAKRMALVRAGYLVWSLTWHDLEGEAADLLGADDGGMAQLQRGLDGKWGTGALRASFGESSLALLARYLASPDPLAWKRAAFTELLRQFEPAKMQGDALKSEVATSVEELPDALRDAFADLPADAALARSGAWRDAPSDIGALLLGLPLAAIRDPDPDGLAMSLHLNDAVFARDGSRRAWNGALRLYNMMQFLPGAWWTTASGAERGYYAAFGMPGPAADEALDTAWSEAVSFATPGLHGTMRALAAGGAPAPEVGFELADSGGRVSAEAELAWPDEQVAVVIARESAAPFTAAGWRVHPADANDLAATLAAELTSNSPKKDGA